MSDLAELLQCVEAATGPDREIDMLLWELAGYPQGNYWNGKAWTDVPPFTASIDAALALVKQMLPDHKWGLHEVSPDTFRAHATKRSPLRPMPNVADMPTAPLAVLAALLKALAAQQVRQ